MNILHNHSNLSVFIFGAVFFIIVITTNRAAEYYLGSQMLESPPNPMFLFSSR